MFERDPARVKAAVAAINNEIQALKDACAKSGITLPKDVSAQLDNISKELQGIQNNPAAGSSEDAAANIEAEIAAVKQAAQNIK